MKSTTTTKSKSNTQSLSMRFHQNILNKFKKSTPEPIKENFEDEIMSFFIHTADLSGAAKKYELSEIWAKKINKEFTAQYKEEIELGLPQTAHFKDLDDDITFHKNECGFRMFIILPLYETMKALDDGFFSGTNNRRLKLVTPVKGNILFKIILQIEDIVKEDEKEKEISIKKNSKKKLNKKSKKAEKDKKKPKTVKKGNSKK